MAAGPGAQPGGATGEVQVPGVPGAGSGPGGTAPGTGGAGVPAAEGLSVTARRVRGASLTSSELEDGAGVAGSPAHSHRPGSGVPGSRRSGQVR
jgi:hypothetical protein